MTANLSLGLFAGHGGPVNPIMLSKEWMKPVLLRDTAASIRPLGLLGARACVMHWVDTLLIKRNRGLAPLRFQIFWGRRLVNRLTK